MKGIIAGVAAGIVGAALWAIIAAATGYEIGWLAWGIGAAVGAGVAWGSEGSPVTGAIAVVIAVLAILAGKYITVEVVLANEMGNVGDEVAQMIENEEYQISWLADQVVYEYQEQGKSVDWPAGVNPEEASSKEDYPPVIWALAEKAWSNMTDDEKEEFKANVRQQVEENIQAYTNSVKADGFFASFGVFDILFAFLAIATAYKVGSKADA